jgi:hypothetical protein
MNKTFENLTFLTQKLFDLAMWADAKKAMQIKSEIDGALGSLLEEQKENKR